jgi:hypothetical protein
MFKVEEHDHHHHGNNHIIIQGFCHRGYDHDVDHINCCEKLEQGIIKGSSIMF